MENNNQNKIDIVNKILLPDNPLNKIIHFNDEGKNFKNFEGKNKNVICDNGRVLLEELAREILMQTFLKDEKHIYSTECYHNGNHRSDLIAVIDKEISNVIEIKEISNTNESNFRNLIDNSFNQVKNFYVNEFKNDCFVSVFIMNLSLIVENSDLISRYFNLTPMERKDKFKVFSNYGIFIETKRYNHLNKDLSDMSWSNLVRHGDFSIKNSNLSIKGMKKVYCEIKNAINLPSSSTNSYGIKNVRNIKDPNIFSEKRDLIIDIIKTSLEAYENQIPSMITTAGKDKDFLVSEDETIFYVRKYSEDFSHLTLCTLNGAIIDGQNSIDSFRWIIETIEKVLINKDSNILTGFENVIYSYFTSLNEGQLNKFLDFLKRTDLPINIEQTQDAKTARQRAISKNNTMQVTKSELAISDIQIPIQLLANELLEKSDINIDFPKKEMFIPSQKLQDRTLTVENLARYVHCFIDYNNTKNCTSSSLFRLSQSLGGATKPKSFELLKEQFIDKVKEDNENSKAIKARIELIKTEEYGLKTTIEELKPLIEHSKDIKDIIDKKYIEIERCKDEKERLFDKLKSLTDVAYTVRDRKNLVALIERIFIIEKNINKQYNKLKQDSNKFNIIKNFISNKEKFVHYIFVMSLSLSPDINIEIKVSEVKDLFWNLVSNIEHISSIYEVDMTSLRNASEDISTCYKKDGTATIMKEPRDEFFKINAKSS